MALVAVGSHLYAGCSVGDQFCTPSSLEEDRDDACPYGPVGGPRLPNLQANNNSCEQVNLQREQDAGPCDITWDDIYTNVIINPMTGNCNAEGCHQPGSLLGGFSIDGTDSRSVFTDLTELDVTRLGGQYLSSNEEVNEAGRAARLKSWFVCNLEGLESGGSSMPPTTNGLRPENGLTDVQRWFMCWVNDPVTYGPGGDGGIAPGDGGVDGGDGGI
ncbi:MAG TPA: hypothetical protein VLS89_06345 [Candidatus Nanopelagicales bacterium]|nr:hypothetical protein [Candidatus Nanopelagicales bacterium]